MNESDSVPQRDISSYDDPDAPWNQAFSEGDIKTWNAPVIEEFRANCGKVGGSYEGATLLLLTTTGAGSGKPHTVPLGVLYRDDTPYLSSFIENKYPAWYHNITANPQVTVELGGKTYHGVGRALTGAEYDEFAGWVLANNALLADFQSRTERPVPLVVLELGAPV
ncbi:nitroreductase family deazaflavin-dependent oxidoreductase [Nocardia nova]|uniref:Nitroreductase family deazaflavin-dependent oxidoreductase n=1 Tax=Nocardia nova TaxID=37330 RepID=A0A2S6AGF6_9NOCA|nr:nitroreductase/quinone reductase family protein [Nocardia nova]PPJ20005.1 nitroreductase family deazaflavin-dependent oxidoreductase [Nocardia nova]PPJ33835.1 nitroreductase family deazaflavin-dependent oxidoreductase [Nocardia nova]